MWYVLAPTGLALTGIGNGTVKRGSLTNGGAATADAVRAADDREVRRLHLDADEERHTLDVVPVVVREEQRQRRILLLHDQVVAEPS